MPQCSHSPVLEPQSDKRRQILIYTHPDPPFKIKWIFLKV